MKTIRFAALALAAMAAVTACGPADMGPSADGAEGRVGTVSSAVSVSDWTDKHVPPEIKSLADTVKSLSDAYSGVSSAIDVGKKFLQLAGFIDQDPTQQQLFDQLRQDMYQVVAAEDWKIDTHVYANRLGAVVTALDEAESQMLTGMPVFAFASTPDNNAGTAVSDAELDDAAYTRLFNESKTDGEWKGVITDRPDHSTGVVYDWRLGVIGLMQLVSLRLQVMAAVDPNFKNDVLYDNELLRHQTKLQAHFDKMVGSVKCGVVTNGTIAVDYPRLGARVACADINTGIQAWKDLPADFQDQPGCSTLVQFQVPQLVYGTDGFGNPTFGVTYVWQGAHEINLSCTTDTQDALKRQVLSQMPLVQLRSLIDDVTVYRDPSLASSTVSASCQSTADQYGIVADSTFGSAPSSVQTWWVQSGCSARARWLDAAWSMARPALDYDNNGAADFTVFRPSTGEWFTLTNSNPWTQLPTVQWGANNDVPVPGHYNGALTLIDRAVWRPSTGEWIYTKPKFTHIGFINVPAGVQIVVTPWGAQGDIPVPGDYDGDGMTDPAVFRPSEGRWYVLPSSGAGGDWSPWWGAAGDIPVTADFDGDGKTDFTVFRPSEGNWYTFTSQGATSVTQFGQAGDIPVAADYDGDGRPDIAVFREGMWYILGSQNGMWWDGWGQKGDIPSPGDFDGDHKTDVAFFRPSEGNWYVWQSSDGGAYWVGWGVKGDLPLP